MITAIVTIAGQTWTITGDDQPNPLAPTPRITAVVDGVTVDINCQYRQITSVQHTGGCTWGVDMSPICTCAPQPADADALYAAARDVTSQACAASSVAEAAVEEAHLVELAAGDTYVRLPRGCEGCPSAVHGGVCTCC